MKRFIKFIVSFLCVFSLAACMGGSSKKLACQQTTTKFINANIDGKVSTIQNMVSEDYKDGMGLYYFKKTINTYFKEHDTSEKTKKEFNKLYKELAKSALRSYDITHYEENPDNYLIFISAKGISFKNMYLKDYADNFSEAIDHYKKSSNHTYKMYIEKEGQETADRHILEEASLDYFKTMRKKIFKYEENDFNIRVTLKEKKGKLTIYRTDLNF